MRDVAPTGRNLFVKQQYNTTHYTATQPEREMKDFFKTILIEVFTDGDWVDYIIGGIMWVLAFTIVGCLILFVGRLIDSSYLPFEEKEGVVTERIYTPAHTTTTHVLVGKAVIPVINYIDDNYEVIVEIEGLKDNFCLNQNAWSALKVGDVLCFKFAKGRISKKLYIKSFCNLP